MDLLPTSFFFPTVICCDNPSVSEQCFTVFFSEKRKEVGKRVGERRKGRRGVRYAKNPWRGKQPHKHQYPSR